MVDLAKQAFSTNNFDLAAEIYERSIKENGPAVDLYLGLADCFARGGNFRRAFETYSQAFRLGVVYPEKLKHLVTSLIETVAKKDGTSGQRVDGCSYMFLCTACRGILNDPVTIPCGHTFCRKCLEKDVTKTCQTCGVVHYFMKVSYIRSNILLTRIIEKWFPNQRKAVKLKADANEHFIKRNFDIAIQLYSQALHLAPHDHLVASNRSHAYASVEKFKPALADAELVICLRPDWPKGYFRKGCALFGLADYEGCVVALLQCLALDSEVATAKNYLSKALHKILCPLPPDDVKSAELHNTLHPSPLRKLINANFDMETLLPHFAADTLQHLQNVIQDTIATATNFSRVKSHQSLADLESLSVEKDWHNPANHCGASGGEDQIRCSSAPASSQSSPRLGAKRPHSCSLSPLSLTEDQINTSRKRLLEPRSPTRQNNKHAKSELSEKPASKLESFFRVGSELLNVEDFECSLCYRLIYQPVTTPCGHSFCRQCLDRCLDHRSVCPLCKSSLAEYLAERRQAITESIQTIVETYFPLENKERKQLHEEEMTELARMGSDKIQEIPIFVCTLAFPSLPCPLHIFEPRYRLMIRQCMESGTRQFGMCMARLGENNEETFADFGTMLEIRDVQFFPDGRSIVDTVGGKRFKVMSRGIRDGYNTAKIEYYDDNQVTEEEVEELNKMQEETYSGVQHWLQQLPERNRARIFQHFGECPQPDPQSHVNSSGPNWVWWAVAVMPLDPQIQLAMLGMKSTRERLQALKRVLSYLRRRGSQ